MSNKLHKGDMMPQPPHGPNGEPMVPLQPRPMTPHEERVNLAVILLERIKQETLDGEEFHKMREAAAKIIREHLEAPVPEPGKAYENLWTPQIAKA